MYKNLHSFVLLSYTLGGINVKINADGYVATIHDVMDTYIDTIPWHVAEEDSRNWFKVHWEGSDYPGSSEVRSSGVVVMDFLCCSNCSSSHAQYSF